MRGKVTKKQLADAIGRITPAYAGKSRYFSGGRRYWRDHPRLCGEKVYPRSSHSFKKGSPPPMRGKAQAAGWTELSIRITPAYAGKSMGYNQRRLGYGDHPRLCGEKEFRRFWGCLFQGSPPPMRGKDSRGILSDLLCRITPAYAGKSHLNCHFPKFKQDHPRLCGEKVRNC